MKRGTLTEGHGGLKCQGRLGLSGRTSHRATWVCQGHFERNMAGGEDDRLKEESLPVSRNLLQQEMLAQVGN